MRMMLCHLTGSLKGRTQFIDTDFVAFGIGESCGIAFDPTIDRAVCPLHAELAVEDHTPVIRDRSGQKGFFVNGEPCSEAALKDGDLLQFGEQGPQVRFRLAPDLAAETKPWRAIIQDSRDIVVRTPHPHYLSPFYLARHILGDIAAHASPGLKVVATVVLLVPLLLFGWLAGSLYQQRQAVTASERRMAELVTQLAAGRLTQAELEQRIERERREAEALHREQEIEIAALTAKLRTLESAQESQQDIQSIRRQLADMRQAQRFAEEIVQRYGNGVGLLQGAYGFKERASGRVLRYQGLDRLGNPYVDKDGNALVTVEGFGPPVVVYVAGTAFIVDEVGTAVTNRHLVRMWESYKPAQQAIEAGYDPDTMSLRLFLPGDTSPYNLRLVALSDKTDLALLRTDRPPAGRPSLVLSSQDDAVRVGAPIVMLSYPGSIDTLLARVPKLESKAVLDAAGGDPNKLAEEVTKRNFIRPLATQGHVSDVSADVITYEAGSATGSSGAPLFDRAGKVFAVNHGRLQRIEGVHLALPIRFVKDLMAGTLGPTPERE
jgi:S1-C subfamily serine protease